MAMSAEPALSRCTSRINLPDSPAATTTSTRSALPKRPRVRKIGTIHSSRRLLGSWSALIRTLLSLLPLPPACRRPSLPAGKPVTGTLFGHKKGHTITFAVQDEPGAEPVLLLDLATPTATLVREMASGVVRIALECRRGEQQVWTMYCNGRRSGYAVSRPCGDGDWSVLRTVCAVSVGAGVMPAAGGGEVMYMRAKFERVVGSMDSEAFYMLSPDGGSGGPELSIFLLRL